MSTILIIDGLAIGLEAALRGAGHQVIVGTDHQINSDKIVLHDPAPTVQFETGDQGKKRAQWKQEKNRHRRSR